MAHFGDIKPVGIERFGAELLESSVRRCRNAMRDPARRCTDRGCDQRRRCNRAPAAARPRQAIEIETLRHRLVCDCAIARTNRVGLRAPLRDIRSIIRMRSEPGFDGGSAIGWKQAIHIGVKLVSRHRHITFHHDLVLII